MKLSRGCDTPSGSVERAQPLADVGEIGIGDAELLEQRPGLWNLATPLVKIGERVGPTEVMGLRLLREAPTLLEQLRRFDDLATIGQRTGHHDSTLSHQFRRRRDLTQFEPEFVDLRPLTQGPIAVGQNGVLLGRIGEETEGLELAGRRLPLLLPVERDAVEFADRSHGRRFVGELFQDPGGVAETIGLEVFGRLGQSFLDPLSPRTADGPTELLAHLAGKIDRCRVALPLRRRARGRLRRILADILDKNPFLGRAGVACRTPFGVGSLGRHRIGNRCGSPRRRRLTLRRSGLDRVTPGSGCSHDPLAGGCAGSAPGNTSPTLGSLECRTFGPARVVGSIAAARTGSTGSTIIRATASLSGSRTGRARTAGAGTGGRTTR